MVAGPRLPKTARLGERKLRVPRDRNGAVSRRAWWTIGVAAVQVVLLAATFPSDVLGTELWHHAASLGAVLAVAGVLHRPMRTRRFLAVGVLASTVLATASGFYLLYWKEGIRADGYQDWGVFWHVVWSWAAMVFFWQHTWVNRVALGHFLRRSLASAGPAVLHLGAYALLVAGFTVTWSPTGRTWFTGGNYIPLSLWTWLVLALPPYILWLAVRPRLARGSVARRFGHWRVRRVVDLGLVPAAALAVLSGLPLLFLDNALDRAGLKYVSKYWHVWPSVLFAVLVFVHGVQAWRAVRAHWRSYGRGAASGGG